MAALHPQNNDVAGRKAARARSAGARSAPRCRRRTILVSLLNHLDKKNLPERVCANVRREKFDASENVSRFMRKALDMAGTYIEVFE
ncbi:MAG: hypothetical protein HY043_18215 [Verrucomicrobia bacterium]|nr:hypothetical protein [Verrucomicrobiota bacterium]